MTENAESLGSFASSTHRCPAARPARKTALLTVMVGGDRQSFDKAKPVIDAYARMVGLMGPAGAGQLTKMINQICIAGLVQGLAEGIHFGKKAGLDIEKVIEVISKGAAGSWQMENRHKTMNAGKYDFGFAVDWMRKDLGICLEEADRNGAKLPVTALVDQFYKDVQADGRQPLGHVVAARAAGTAPMAELSPASTAAEIIAHLRSIGSEESRQGMMRYGIKIDRALGISHGVQRDIARKIKRNHERAFELWESGIMEAQFIASVTADPKRFTAGCAPLGGRVQFLGHRRRRLGPLRRHRSLARPDRGIRRGRARIRAPHRLRDDGVVDRPPQEGAGRDVPWLSCR